MRSAALLVAVLSLCASTFAVGPSTAKASGLAGPRGVLSPTAVVSLVLEGVSVSELASPPAAAALEALVRTCLSLSSASIDAALALESGGTLVALHADGSDSVDVRLAESGECFAERSAAAFAPLRRSPAGGAAAVTVRPHGKAEAVPATTLGGVTGDSADQHSLLPSPLFSGVSATVPLSLAASEHSVAAASQSSASAAASAALFASVACPPAPGASACCAPTVAADAVEMARNGENVDTVVGLVVRVTTRADAEACILPAAALLRAMDRVAADAKGESLGGSNAFFVRKAASNESVVDVNVSVTTTEPARVMALLAESASSKPHPAGELTAFFSAAGGTRAKTYRLTFGARSLHDATALLRALARAEATTGRGARAPPASWAKTRASAALEHGSLAAAAAAAAVAALAAVGFGLRRPAPSGAAAMGVGTGRAAAAAAAKPPARPGRSSITGPRPPAVVLPEPPCGASSGAPSHAPSPLRVASARLAARILHTPKAAAAPMSPLLSAGGVARGSLDQAPPSTSRLRGAAAVAASGFLASPGGAASVGRRGARKGEHP